MRLLVVFCHPNKDSFGAEIFRTAMPSLAEAGHELRGRDLYRDNFDPVMSPEERLDYLGSAQKLMERNALYVDDIRWMEGLVVIYPTWYYGMPAMLKGWLDCVWLPEVTFSVSEEKGARARFLLWDLKLFVGITTSGSPWWWLKLIGDPGRRVWTRGLFHPFLTRTKTIWMQLYDMNQRSDAECAAFLGKVDRKLRSLKGSDI